MRVTVLHGGPSAEREVSLVSGQAVIDALREMGHEVFGSDVAPDNLAALDCPADVIFPVLHGEFGESGELQDILERRGLPFVGSSSAASRLGMNKVHTKRAWVDAGLPTPEWLIIDRAAFTAHRAPPLPAPCVVKAVSSGSSIDVFVCRDEASTLTAMDTLFKRHDQALIEQFIEGPELTVGLLEEKPLAPIRIVPKSEFFDFNAKYKATDTEHRFDTGLPRATVEKCKDLAARANAVVGAIDLARVDIMLDATNEPYLLEINTLPGFTPKSLLPEAAKHDGIEFGPLVDRLVKRAQARGRRG